jgi:hypothetical protein
VSPEEVKIRKKIANESRRATGLYEQDWSTYAIHFRDAAHVAELGYDEWVQRYEDDSLE